MKDSDSTIGTYKVVLLGEAGVGKTSIIAQFMDQTFQSDLQSSTGGTYSSKSFTYGDNKVITLEIWDTAGQERYRSLTTMFYKDANAACLIYDITRKITFEEIQTYWVEQIRENAPQDIMLILVGNKSDLTDKEEVDEGIARDYAREIGAIYCTTSAKDYIQTCDLYQLEEVMPLVRKIEQNLLIYCKLKFPANCIEKCFENTDNCVREHILEYLINNYKDNIIEILLDQYGIYIILKALNINSMLKQRLLEIIFRRGNEIKYINLFDVKYRGIVKIINSIKEIRMLLCCGKQVDNNTNVNIININNNNINTVNNCQDYNYTYNYNEIPNRTKFNQLNKRKGQK
jgi:small GTP-binding protein